MKIEIWSDVMCPFCYIGKRRLEKALLQFPNNNQIEIIWKSYQLNPALKTDPGKSVNEYLVETKGWDEDYAKQANDYVTDLAAMEGLTYNMNKAVVANSFDAHRILQLAKEHHKDDDMEEALFNAYFTEGKNIADHATLAGLAVGVGLDELEVQQALAGDLYADKVREDIYEAQQIGVRGVPFFFFNGKYAVSGAQAVHTFVTALHTAWKEKEN